MSYAEEIKNLWREIENKKKPFNKKVNKRVNQFYGKDEGLLLGTRTVEEIKNDCREAYEKKKERDRIRGDRK